MSGSLMGQVDGLTSGHSFGGYDTRPADEPDVSMVSGRPATPDEQEGRRAAILAARAEAAALLAGVTR